MDRFDVDWSGYIPAVTTPFDRDGSLDLEAFASQLEWLIAEKVDGVIVAGTTGEWFSLNAEERAALFRHAVVVARGRIPVLGGCSAYTADESAHHARAGQAAGLDGILLTAPPYLVPSRHETVQFFRDVAAETALPICVYNWPRGVHVDLDTQLLVELSDIENVVAVKNSTGDLRSFLDGLYQLADRVRYFGLPTSRLGADLAGLGRGDGLMGAGAVLGADHSGFWRALRLGDHETALRLGERDRVLMTSWFNADYGAKFGNAPAIMKAALRLRGVPAGYVRRPYLELTDADLSRVRDTLHALGIETVDA